MIPDTPQTLLRRIAKYANGDDAAEWAKFTELYEPVIRLYVSQSGNASAADVDDIVQDIFIRLVDVLRRGEYKRMKGRFRSYLAAMVRRCLIDRHRRAMCRKADMQTDIVDDEIASTMPDPSVIVDMRLRAARRAAATEHVLNRTMLDAKTVAVYREYAIERQDAGEVARRYGLTLNALRQIKHRVGKMIDAIEKKYLP